MASMLQSSLLLPSKNNALSKLSPFEVLQKLGINIKSTDKSKIMHCFELFQQTGLVLRNLMLEENNKQLIDETALSFNTSTKLAESTCNRMKLSLGIFFLIFTIYLYFLFSFFLYYYFFELHTKTYIFI